MLTTRRCSFCGGHVRAGEGVMLAKNDGSVQWYCSSKCRKNALFLRRDPRKLKWTAHHRGREKK
ncbi:MAG: 50S ribosomal protein L24e [Gammaproteobacteria bacterium]